MSHPSTEELLAGQAAVAESPSEEGTVELIVARPLDNERRVLEAGELVVGEGLVGDNYLARGGGNSPEAGDTPEGKPHPEAQLNLMNARSIDLAANGDKERWPLAGDQFFVDFDLSRSNAPTGTRIAIGSAVIEVSAKPHTGCAKFRERFGIDAARWVNSDEEQRYRGINAMVVESGSVKPGDAIRKLGSAATR